MLPSIRALKSHLNMQRSRAWFAALCAMLVIGCETLPMTPPTTTGAPTPVIEATPETAEKADSVGDYVVAAREYEQLAQVALPPQKQHYLLNAVDALIKGGWLKEARQKLETVSTAAIEPGVAVRKRILEARLALAEGTPTRAIVALDDAARRTPELPPHLRAEIHEARAQAELGLNRPLAALPQLIQREQYLVGQAVADNQLQLWRALESIPREQLREALAATRDNALAGWIELALTAHENGQNAAAMTHAVAQWRTRYPAHPAGKLLLDSLTLGAPALIGRIERIALLLPLTSDYAIAAQALRDGFLAMHSTTPEADRPKVTIYDLGSNAALAPQVYERAVRDGAQVVVGPLGREATDAVVRQSALGVPTLLLSHTDERPAGPARLFQFGLPPEQEAREAAERAYLDGCRQVALLHPAGAWGERMVSAFSGHWQRLGGLVLTTQPYAENEADYAEPIKRLLNIPQSESRKALLENRIGQKIQFEARPRHDIRCLFLAADARSARLIKPQINYFRAHQLPVYATSHVYTGKIDPIQDADLDGVQFGDMPWMLVNGGRIADLRQSLQRDWPHAHSDLDRLYALGMDSYAILPHLNRISAENAARFNGVTSGLSLDRDGRLHRQLAWARFRNGTPRLLDAR